MVQFVHVFQLYVCAGTVVCGNTATAVRLVFVEWRRGVQVQKAISITSLLQLRK